MGSTESITEVLGKMAKRPGAGEVALPAASKKLVLTTHKKSQK